MSASAFSLLHTGVQMAIHRRRWTELNHIQVETIHKLLQGDGHLLICAKTAGGKTEAAFLPIISRLAENPRPSVQALYVGPLVALINDQFSRLEALCADVEVPVHRWHGAASATEKRKLRDSPGGILLITPESLESNFINYGVHLRRIYAELEFVVIDEMHSFLSGVRGAHLRSLLARLSEATGRKPKVIGLSATIGDPVEARSFIAPDAPDTVQIIMDRGDSEIRIGIQALLRGCQVSGNSIPPMVGDAAIEIYELLTTGKGKAGTQIPKPIAADQQGITGLKDELDEIAGDILRTCPDGTNLVFANAKQGLEILADRLHEEVRKRGISPDPIHIHHGSLSKDVREETEMALRSGRPVTVLCSSTLEMGIDIGSVKRVAQMDPPWSVSSLRQRLGRSGRRRGEAAVMRIYTRDDALDSNSSITDLLFPQLLRAIALVKKMLEKWMEPHDANRLNLSTLVHQILSCLRQTGGMDAVKMYGVLSKAGAFRDVTVGLFRDVLKSLGGKQLIEQTPAGELILAPGGERITADWDFYAAFEAAEEFSVRHDGRAVGKLQSTLIPPVGENLILGGRRWRVDFIVLEAKCVEVSPSKGGKPPVFHGHGGEIHTVVVEEMAHVLADREEPSYLNHEGKLLLGAAREIAARSGLLSTGFVVRPEGIQWFPWLGTRGLVTLELHALCDGIAVTRDELSLFYQRIDLAGMRRHWESIVNDTRSSLELAQRMPVKIFEKFDDTLSIDILDKANARDRLDLPGAKGRASDALEQMKRLFP